MFRNEWWKAVCLTYALAGAPNAAHAVIEAGGFSPGDITITEVMPNPTEVFDSAGEWIEIRNSAVDDINLNGLILADDDFDLHTITADVIVAPGDYAILARNGDSIQNGGLPFVDYVYADYFLGNNGDEVVIFDSATEIARMTYTGAMETAGKSLALRCVTDDTTDQGNWPRYDGQFYNTADQGTPGVRNDIVPDSDNDGVGDICGVVFPDDALIVNELMPNPDLVFDSQGEWFEVYNTTDEDINMHGMTIADEGIDSHAISSTLIVPAGGYALLARNSDAAQNGGLPLVDYVYLDYFLGNNGDEIVILAGTQVISTMRYTGAMVAAGTSLALTCPDADTEEPTNYVQYTDSTYNGTDTGTPGAPNGPDSDGDGVQDDCDVCPFDPLDDPDADGFCDDVDLCPGTVFPEATVPGVRLGTNRFALVDGDFVFDTTSPNGRGPRLGYTLDDTGGCSCEQIIEALELGQGHVKFGCSISAMEEWVAGVPEP